MYTLYTHIKVPGLLLTLARSEESYIYFNIAKDTIFRQTGAVAENSGACGFRMYVNVIRKHVKFTFERMFQIIHFLKSLIEQTSGKFLENFLLFLYF